MRVRAALVVTLVLVAGCSDKTGWRHEGGSGTVSRPPSRTTSTPWTPTPTTPMTTTTSPQAAPAADAPMSDVTTWVKEGEPADPGAFHSATRDGQVTQLQNGDVAFTKPSGKTSCMTDSMFSSGDLACLVSKPANPPPQPAETHGQWVPGWIQYNGTSLTVGAIHGDPGRFVYGDGPELPYGKPLKFGDYQCRVDPAALFCVNYTHQSGARISDEGVETFGCLKPVPPSPDVGLKFDC